jgi:hypothetical protein
MATLSAAPRMRLSLRIVATVDFRLGVPTHYETLKRKKLLGDIDEDETILLVSQTGRQLAFVFSEMKIEARNGEPVTVISHHRVQLDRHTPFNHKMLSEYAAKARIHLIGIKRFEDHLAEAAA